MASKKIYNWPGAIIVLASVALVVFLAFEARRCTRECPPEGKVLVNKGYLDSLRAVAELPADTVVVTKIQVRDTTIYIIKNKPEPFYIDLPTNERHYVDSVKMLDDGINAWVRIRSRGVVEQIMWGYKPVYKTITKEITVPEPYPVYREQVQKGLYVEGGIGWGAGSPGFKVGLRWHQGSGFTYGAEVVQFQHRYYTATIGYKIF